MRRTVALLVSPLVVYAAMPLLLASCSGAIATAPGGGAIDGGAADASGDATIGTPVGPSEPLTAVGVYGATRLYLGETNRAGSVMKDAWRDYGENLDGLVSTRAAPGPNHCKRFAGADSSKHEDGRDGIDNAFGRTILAFILGLVPTPTNTANASLAKGGRALAVTLLPPSGAEPARVGLFTLGESTSPPKLDGTDVRAAARASVVNGPDTPVAISTTPAMGGRVVSSGITSGTYTLELPLSGDTWRIPIRVARVSMTLSEDGTNATNGTLSGVISVEELVAEIGRIAGRISTQLCSGSTLDTMKTTIRQAADILLDGTQDGSRDCDGISIGIGFDAVKVTAEGTAPDLPPSPDPCR